MKKYLVKTIAFVTEYGDWGREHNIIIFNDDNLTEEQWDTLADLPDSMKLSYAKAVMDGDDLTEYEE
jgi:hypothetical protein